MNIRSGAETSIARLHELVGEITDRAIPPVLSPEPTGGIERMCLRVSRAASMLDWTPKITLDDGIAALAGATAVPSLVSRTPTQPGTVPLRRGRRCRR